MSVTASGITGRMPMSSRWRATSSVPDRHVGALDLRAGPRPAARASGDAAGLQADDASRRSRPWLRSTISWAMRVSGPAQVVGAP